MDVKDFLPELRKMIHGPLQAAMVDELFLSTISFCKASRVLRQTINAGTVTEGDELIITPSPATLSVWGVASITDKNGCLLKRDVHYKQLNRGTVTFIDDLEGVTIITWSYPNNKVDMPDTLLTDYSQAICAGAAKALFLQHGREWFSGDMAGYYDRIYTEGFRLARREIESDQFGEFQNPDTPISFWN